MIFQSTFYFIQYIIVLIEFCIKGQSPQRHFHIIPKINSHLVTMALSSLSVQEPVFVHLAYGSSCECKCLSAIRRLIQHEGSFCKCRSCCCNIIDTCKFRFHHAVKIVCCCVHGSQPLLIISCRQLLGKLLIGKQQHQ